MKTLTLIVAPLLLAGCGASAATPTVTVTASRTVTEAAPAPVVPEAPTSDGDLIRDLLSSQGFYYSGPSSDLDSVSQSICDALDSGVSANILGSLAMDSGFTADEAASLVAAAIVVKCPWNKSVV